MLDRCNVQCNMELDRRLLKNICTSCLKLYLWSCASLFHEHNARVFELYFYFFIAWIHHNISQDVHPIRSMLPSFTCINRGQGTHMNVHLQVPKNFRNTKLQSRHNPCFKQNTLHAHKIFIFLKEKKQSRCCLKIKNEHIICHEILPPDMLFLLYKPAGFVFVKS